MAKRDGTEEALRELLGVLGRGRVALLTPRFAAERETGHVELSIATRGGDSSFLAPLIREAAQEALEVLRSGTEDPVTPAWRRLTRMQREIVLEALTEARARHMRLAAEASVDNTPQGVSAEYAKADAFDAALRELDVMDVDETGQEFRPEPLAAIAPRTKPKTSIR